ncbi:MAG: hypothetical protein ACKON8_03125 [Planctomycetota bacterium]
MGHFLFFLFAGAAGLLWTAACTAAAARVERGWHKALLAALGAGVPVIALLPIVAASWWHAFGMRVEPNWFPQVFTVLVSLFIGGAWIVWAGLAPRDEGETPAARWPLIGLIALAAIAASVTAGVLLILDNAVQAQAAYLRLEAANLMQVNLPPIVTDDENAAPLHLQAGAAITADKEFDAEASPLDPEGDVMREEVTVFLARHAATLDLVRRAADRGICRFARDWSRPPIDLVFSEVLTLRNEGRLLALAARRAAAEERHADALADVFRIGRLGHHAAAEPFLVSYLMGNALESIAWRELADLLPQLGPDDAPLLDSTHVRDLVGRPLDLLPALYGEEAFGLAAFAGFADGRATPSEILGSDQGDGVPAGFGVEPGFRVFHLPGDLAGYRRMMHAFQQLAADRELSANHAETRRRAEALEKSLVDHPPGVLSRLVVPAITSVFQARARSEALHRAAAVLVAATRQRLESGGLPLEPAAFGTTPPFVLPTDPFAEGNKPLLMKRSDAGLVTYSVGPDGKDDGGPAPRGEEAEEGNDDVGFVMAVR